MLRWSFAYAKIQYIQQASKGWHYRYYYEAALFHSFNILYISDIHRILHLVNRNKDTDVYIPASRIRLRKEHNLSLFFFFFWNYTILCCERRGNRPYPRDFGGNCGLKKIIGSFSANTELLYLQQFFEVRKIVHKKCSRFSAAFFCPFFRLLFTFNQ